MTQSTVLEKSWHQAIRVLFLQTNFLKKKKEEEHYIFKGTR